MKTSLNITYIIFKTIDAYYANEFTPMPSFEHMRMSELIKRFLEHFKNPNSVNMPLPVPDPLPMPDRVYQLLAKVSTTNVQAFGVSRLKIENLTSDIVEMKVGTYLIFVL